MTSWQFLALIRGNAERQSLSTMRISLGGARRSRSRDRRVEMVRGSRRIPSPSLLLITRAKTKKKETHELVNFLPTVNATYSLLHRKCQTGNLCRTKCRAEVARANSELVSLAARPKTNQSKSIKIPLAHECTATLCLEG